MKIAIFIISIVLLALVAILLQPVPVPAQRLPVNAFLVSVRACDIGDGWVLPFKVTTVTAGTNVVPIQDVALRHYVLSTFCQWTDCTTRTFRVESAGYEPREYTVSGKKDVIAVLRLTSPLDSSKYDSTHESQ